MVSRKRAVEEVVEKNEEGNTTYKIPLTCPCCGSELVHKGVHLFCPNYDCPDQAKGRISFFSSRDQMDIDSMGPKTVELLWNNKLLKRVEDIPYKIACGKINELCQIACADVNEHHSAENADYRGQIKKIRS